MRRGFLKGAGVATTALFASTAKTVQAARITEDRPLIIDCHAHVYSDDEAAYPPIENPYRPPAGDGTVAHLRARNAGRGR